MFKDNGDAFKKAASSHLHSAMCLIATVMETAEPEKLLIIADHLQKGARFATREIAPDHGEPPSLELCLYHPEAGWLPLQAITAPPATQH